MQKVLVTGGLTYQWGGEPLKIGDVVEVPALPWQSSSEWVTVKGIDSDYEGPTKNIVQKIILSPTPTIPEHTHSPTVYLDHTLYRDGKHVVVTIHPGCSIDISWEKYRASTCPHFSLSEVVSYLSSFGARRLTSYGWGSGSGTGTYVICSTANVRAALANGMPVAEEKLA